MAKESPEYIICLECESPVYVFEWSMGTLQEAICPACGNDSVEDFITEEDYEALISRHDTES